MEKGKVRKIGFRERWGVPIALLFDSRTGKYKPDSSGKPEVRVGLQRRQGEALERIAGAGLDSSNSSAFQKLNNYISIMNKRPDFIAELRYYTTEQGGRKTPAFSKYRPQVKFPFSDIQTSGQQNFLNKDIAYPGDKVTAEITINSC